MNEIKVDKSQTAELVIITGDTTKETWDAVYDIEKPYLDAGWLTVWHV